ncbi:hypothetical protein X975_19466, partial [Stegodyphus mimosarum]
MYVFFVWDMMSFYRMLYIRKILKSRKKRTFYKGGFNLVTEYAIMNKNYFHLVVGM